MRDTVNTQPALSSIATSLQNPPIPFVNVDTNIGGVSNQGNRSVLNHPLPAPAAALDLSMTHLADPDLIKALCPWQGTHSS